MARQMGGDEPWELTGLVHQRIRTSSGLYQMFGVMCDLFVFSEGTETSRRTFSDPVGVGYQQEVPCDMVPHIIERHWRHTSASDERLRVRFLTLSFDSDNVHSHGTNRMKNDTFNQGLLEPFSWLSSQAFSPNCTNSRSLTEHFNPCFTHESCHICAVADGCSWCPATTLCVSKGTCPYSENPLFQPIDFFSKKVNGSNNCEFVDKEVRLALQTTFVDFNMTRDVNYWRDRDEDIQWKKYQVGKLQRNMEFDSRIWRHPSNHHESKLGLASYQAAFNEPLWKDLMEYTDYVTKVEKIKIGKKWLEEESNSKKSRMRAKNKCKRITSCGKCIQIPECAFCFEEGMCVVDSKNSCKSKTDHIGGEYGMKECPLPGLRRMEL